MTKSTITREQVQKIIVAADEVITALAGANEDVHPDDSKKMCDLWDDLNDRYAPPEVVRELARMALAAMDGEPVKRVNADQMHRVCLEANRHLDKYVAMAKEVNKLLGRTPAQQAPVVLDEMTPQQASRSYGGEVRGYRDGWNACRAAMLQAEPVTTANKLGNSPVIGIDPASGPDRTVEVSYVAPPGYVMVPKEPTGKQWAAGVQAFDSGMDKVTRIYKAMLAAAPQEVKGE
ncbi:TPA: hypothetical protein ACIJR7_000450 [Klebsiella aerogenes]